MKGLEGIPRDETQDSWVIHTEKRRLRCELITLCNFLRRKNVERDVTNDRILGNGTKVHQRSLDWILEKCLYHKGGQTLQQAS